MEQTAEMFVRRMLAKGDDWMGILSVARCARGGKWRKEAERILVEMGKMPVSQQEINKAYELEFKTRAKEDAELVRLKKENRKMSVDKKAPKA